MKTRRVALYRRTGACLVLSAALLLSHVAAAQVAMMKKPGGASYGAPKKASASYGGAKRESGVSVSLKNMSELPKNRFKLPTMSKGKQLYTVLEFADKERLMVLAQAKTGEKLFTKMYFDANGNKDLTDDQVVKGSLMDQSSRLSRAEFSSIKTDSKSDTSGVPSKFSAQLTFNGDLKSASQLKPGSLKLVLDGIERSALKNVPKQTARKTAVSTPKNVGGGAGMPTFGVPMAAGKR